MPGWARMARAACLQVVAHALTVGHDYPAALSKQPANRGLPNQEESSQVPTTHNQCCTHVQGYTTVGTFGWQTRVAQKAPSTAVQYTVACRFFLGHAKLVSLKCPAEAFPLLL